MGYLKMRKRKLITEATMRKLHDETELGVPLARAMKNLGIDMSRPAVAKLLDHYRACLTIPGLADHAMDSLFPDWLTIDCQEQPDNAEYDGYFPHGAWV